MSSQSFASCIRSPLRNLYSSECATQMLSKGLSAVILSLSLQLKIPQIRIILANQGVQGLSETALWIELIASSCYISYNYRVGSSFALWGEVFFIGLQNLMILFLFDRFQKKSQTHFRRLHRILFVLSLGLFVLAIKKMKLPYFLIKLLAIVPSPIRIVSILPQVILNVQQGHTGHLALPTMLLTFLGGCARCFTLLAGPIDPVLLFPNVAVTGMHSIPVLQILYYWKSTQRYLKSNTEKENKADISKKKN